MRPQMAETVLSIAGMLTRQMTLDELAEAAFRGAEKIMSAEYEEDQKMEEWIDLGGEA